MTLRGIQKDTETMDKLTFTASGADAQYTVSAFDFKIDGKTYTKAAASNVNVPDEDVNTGAAFPKMFDNQRAVVVWGVQANGTVKLAMGEIVKEAEVAPWPGIPDDVCPFAYQVLKTGDVAATGITFGTSNWNATGFTQESTTISTLPEHP